jgi:CheY-like chemotaxis protein
MREYKAVAMPHADREAKRTMSSPSRVLVVDDNADLCETMRLILEHEGYEVRCANEGRRAIALLREWHADVLITDLFMPDYDGFEMIATMRTEHPETRVIVMSGQPFSKVDYLGTAKLAGADEVLRKPVHPDDLLAVL